METLEEYNIHVWGHKGHYRLAPYFLLCLLTLLLRRLCFCFGFFEIVGLAIGRTQFKGGEVAVSFSRCSL